MSVRGARLLTLALAGICGVLLLLALVLQAGWGRGYSWLVPDDSAALSAASIDREPFKLPVESAYSATDARPLFNDDRKPTPEGPDDVTPPPPPSQPLNVALTGIVLTPQLHLALIQDKAKNTTISLKEGMPMPGDQGGWTLTEIKPRSAIFKEMSGDEVEVELTTAVASQKPGNAPGARGKPGSAVAANQAGNKSPPPPPPGTAGSPNPQAAEQLQRRIEERRKQMRDEAERLKNQGPNNPPNH